MFPYMHPTVQSHAEMALMTLRDVMIFRQLVAYALKNNRDEYIATPIPDQILDPPPK